MADSERPTRPRHLSRRGRPRYLQIIRYTRRPASVLHARSVAFRQQSTAAFSVPHFDGKLRFGAGGHSDVSAHFDRRGPVRSIPRMGVGVVGAFLPSIIFNPTFGSSPTSGPWCTMPWRGLASAWQFVCLFVCLFVCFTDSGSHRSVALLRMEPTLPWRCAHHMALSR